MSVPAQNPADVLEFFERTIADQIHLTAIDPEKHRGVAARDFGSNFTDAQIWAQARNAEGFNVYYTVNRVRSGLNAKPAKGDIAEVRFAHVDVDPPKGKAFSYEAREAAYKLLLASSPSVIIWSGNGWQALWRLGKDVSTDEVEDINRGLIDAMGGDVGTFDASRLLRVPGLVNWPDERKRALGRKPVTAAIEIGDQGYITDVHQLRAAFPSPTQAVRERACIALGDVPLLTADDLGLPEDAYLRRIIDEPDGADRSADTFAFACEALRQGLTQQQVAGVSEADLILAALILIAAALYSSVGHAGASGYLAAMALFGLSPEVMRPTALALNILVALLAVYRYSRAGQNDWRLLLPFAIASVPAAFLGGLIEIPPWLYRPLVGVVLLFSAFHLVRTARRSEGIDAAVKRPPVPAALASGAGLGILSGLTGTGGGIFLSPLLLFMGWAGTRPASGVAASFILLNSIAGLAGTTFSVGSLPAALPLWAIAALIGGLIGTQLGTRTLPVPGVRYALGLVLVVAGGKMILT